MQNDGQALATLADDGCPHHAESDMPLTLEVPLPRRPGIGLRKSKAQLKREAMRPCYPFCAGNVIEVAPDIYVDSRRDAVLLKTEDDGDYQVIVLYVSKR